MRGGLSPRIGETAFAPTIGWKIKLSDVGELAQTLLYTAESGCPPNYPPGQTSGPATLWLAEEPVSCIHRGVLGGSQPSPGGSARLAAASPVTYSLRGMPDQVPRCAIDRLPGAPGPPVETKPPHDRIGAFSTMIAARRGSSLDLGLCPRPPLTDRGIDRQGGGGVRLAVAPEADQLAGQGVGRTLAVAGDWCQSG